MHVDLKKTHTHNERSQRSRIRSKELFLICHKFVGVVGLRKSFVFLISVLFVFISQLLLFAMNQMNKKKAKQDEKKNESCTQRERDGKSN